MDNSLTRPLLSGTKGDARWQQWLAKGRAHDADVRYRARIVAVSIAALAAFALAVRLTLF